MIGFFDMYFYVFSKMYFYNELIYNNEYFQRKVLFYKFYFIFKINGNFSRLKNIGH